MLLCSESKAQTKTNKTFSQEKPALLMVSTHGQRECIVDKSAGNFPTIFRKPFIQTSESDKKSFFPIHSQNVPMDSWNADFTAVPELVFSKTRPTFRQIIELIEYWRNFLRKRCFLRRFLWIGGLQFRQSYRKAMAFKPKSFLSKYEKEKHCFKIFYLKLILQTSGRSFSLTLLNKFRVGPVKVK